MFAQYTKQDIDKCAAKVSYFRNHPTRNISRNIYEIAKFFELIRTESRNERKERMDRRKRCCYLQMKKNATNGIVLYVS